MTMISLFSLGEIKVTLLNRNRGGQHVGVDVGVMVEHIPTGLKASCDFHHSNFKNREVCLEMIAAALTSPLMR